MSVHVHRRKGFVKLALRYGYSLTPCYSFGESDLFSNLQGGWKLRLALNHWQIPGVFYWGCSWAPWLPKRKPLKLAIGDPVRLPLTPNPTEADVEKYHAIYVAALQALFTQEVQGTSSEGRAIEFW